MFRKVCAGDPENPLGGSGEKTSGWRHRVQQSKQPSNARQAWCRFKPEPAPNSHSLFANYECTPAHGPDVVFTALHRGATTNTSRMKGNMTNYTNKKLTSGVMVGTYAPDEVTSKDGDGRSVVNQNPVIGWIEPASKEWLAWFTEKGDLLLYTKREKSGAVLGEPIEVRGNGSRYVGLRDEDDLFVHGKSSDHIWTMEDKAGLLGLRFDCGDAGTLYVSRKQAIDLRDQLNQWLNTELPQGSAPLVR